MIRVYNRTFLDNPNSTPELQGYDQARQALVRDQAYRFGLQHRLLYRVPSALEAFDGDFTLAARLVSQLLVWGLGDLRVAATSRTERMSLIDLYGVDRPINIQEIDGDGQASGVVRVHNTLPQDEDASTDMKAARDYISARLSLVRGTAIAFGLKEWIPSRLERLRLPSSVEAFDGNFVQGTRLISQLLAWGVGNLEVSVTAYADYTSLTDLYSVTVPVQVGELTDQVAAAQEADRQSDMLAFQVSKAPLVGTNGKGKL